MRFTQERERRIFERWVSEVEQLLDRHLDREGAFEAWGNGYSAAQFAAEVAGRAE